MAEKAVTVRNRAGIHARPAALIAQTANKFASEVLIEKNDSTVINAKSIMGVFSLDLTQPLTMIINSDSDSEITNQIAPFIFVETEQ